MYCILHIIVANNSKKRLSYQNLNHDKNASNLKKDLNSSVTTKCSSDNVRVWRQFKSVIL